jgi:DNA-binding NarL/FixJ family response regulator
VLEPVQSTAVDPNVRVLIAEDEILMRSGLRLVLERADLEVVGEAGDESTLWSLTESLRPDIVVTDIRMPPTYTDEGLRFALSIRATQPQIAVLVLSQHVQRKYAVDLVARRAGGTGYLLKQRVADVDGFCRAVQRVAAGGTVLDPEVVEVLLAKARRERPVLGALTPRQTDVLGLMAQGRSNASIARLLAISEHAVDQQSSQLDEQLHLGAADSDDPRRALNVVRFLNGSGSNER